MHFLKIQKHSRSVVYYFFQHQHKHGYSYHVGSYNKYCLLWSIALQSLAMLEPGKTTCEASLASYNKHKNRFPNILACECNRDFIWSAGSVRQCLSVFQYNCFNILI